MSRNLPHLPAPTLHDILLASAEAAPRIAATELRGVEETYAETAERARRFASGLVALGVRKGDRVGVMLPNVPEFLHAYFGALMTGATVVLYNTMLTPREIDHLTRDSGAKVLVHLDRYEAAVREGTRDAGELKTRIVARRADPKAAADAEAAAATDGGASIVDFDALVADGDPNFAPVAVSPDDLALLVYTSGTTGKPKGAMLSHGNVLSNLAALGAARPPSESARAIVALPLFHCFGLIAVMTMTVMRAGTCYLIERFDAGLLIETLLRKRITTFSGTPTMFFHVLNHPSSQGARFPDLMRASSGGAPLPVEIRKAWRERFGMEMGEGYGLSEASVSLCGYAEGMPIKSGSVGVPWPGIEMTVVDDEGREVMIGEVGEIVASGPTIMKGYWNNPEATAEAIRGGRLHTGDLGFMDDKGYFSIVDRKKDLIIKGGYNIYPREIEEVLYESPEVNMAAVVGVPDPEKGERVEAVVSLKPGRETTPEELMARLRERLAKYKLPSSIEILPELPTGPTGKILRRELRARATGGQGGSGAK